jgi:drug/metabolite transporter (DMT)-like permease
MNKNQVHFIALALFSAIMFGISAPLAKLLLGEFHPVSLAAFLYLGSGLSLLVIKIFQRLSRNSDKNEARLVPVDYKWLGGATLAGGVIGPILLLFSLQSTPAATASLLLNFESVATAIIAVILFKEAFSNRALWAVLSITVATILLSFDKEATWGFSFGAIGIVAACLFWGLDNNLTRNISAKDPITIVCIKGLAAGLFSLCMASLIGYPLPAWDVVLKALMLGSISYGVSIIFFIWAMRGLGASRTSALFSTAPLSGLILSIFLFREAPSFLFFPALLIMAFGTFLIVNEKHNHDHIHEALDHDHSHIHEDGHHDHTHDGIIDPKPLKHTHIHTHERMVHRHNHMPDTHHRHSHMN